MANNDPKDGLIMRSVDYSDVWDPPRERSRSPPNRHRHSLTPTTTETIPLPRPMYSLHNTNTNATSTSQPAASHQPKQRPMISRWDQHQPPPVFHTTMAAPPQPKPMYSASALVNDNDNSKPIHPSCIEKNHVETKSHTIRPLPSSSALPRLQTGIPAIDARITQNKLCLVLDLDHTLLHSVLYQELETAIGKMLEHRVEVETALPAHQRSLFRLDSVRMFTKLRPGVYEFLKQASELFELWIHTNGNQAYSQAVVPLLDPEGLYFGGQNQQRVIAQGASRIEDLVWDQPKALLPQLDPITIVIDDSHAVWQAHPNNLIAVERYCYFPSLRMPGAPSLLISQRDESEKHGMLMSTLTLLRNIHNTVFLRLKSTPAFIQANGNLSLYDVRLIIPSFRSTVLQGLHIVFSRVIPLDIEPSTHELWKLAENFGAKCSKTIEKGVTTHLVATDGNTDKALAAVAAGVIVTSPDWLKASCLLWKRADEGKFAVGGSIERPG